MKNLSESLQVISICIAITAGYALLSSMVSKDIHALYTGLILTGIALVPYIGHRVINKFIKTEKK